MNISSIIVQTRQENYDKVVEMLKESGLCDYHFGDKDKGKIIITIEGEGVEEEIKKLTAIQSMPFIAAADMMQSYQEELDEAIRELNAADEIPACSMMTPSMPRISSITGILKRDFKYIQEHIYVSHDQIHYQEQSFGQMVYRTARQF